MIWQKGKHLLSVNHHHTGFRPSSPRFDFCDRHSRSTLLFIETTWLFILCWSFVPIITVSQYCTLITYNTNVLFMSRWSKLWHCEFMLLYLCHANTGCCCTLLHQEQKYRTLQRSVASFTTFSEMNNSLAGLTPMWTACCIDEMLPVTDPVLLQPVMLKAIPTLP